MKKKNNYVLGILMILVTTGVYVLLSVILSTVIQLFYLPGIYSKGIPQELINDAMGLQEYLTAELYKTSFYSVANFIWMFLGFGIAFLWLLSLKKYALPVKEALNKTRVGLLVAIGLAVQGVISTVMTVFGMILPPSFMESMQALEKSLIGADSGSVLMMIASGIGAPLAEEFFFRGIALRYSRKYMPDIVAIVLTSLTFGCFHLSNLSLGKEVAIAVISQVIYATVVGILLGMIAVRFKSVWASVIVHLTVNISAVLTGQIDNMILAAVILAVIGIIGVVGIYFLWKPAGAPDEQTEAEKMEILARQEATVNE